ncbi:Arm DNA-binding domain-containing protein [Pseudoalteromonas sp. S4741]|uniref:Arm DNA-binding domain-containing protein n=1 Tax=Pseudoalteromonas sp. S4741 TaxID=579563 RepID=UPI0032E4C54C
MRKLLGKNQRPCVLSHRDSLSVRVSAKGTITWQYRCRVGGKQVIISLGRYPGLSIQRSARLHTSFSKLDKPRQRPTPRT